MPEHIRALFVITFLATVGFSLSKKLASQNVSNSSFNQWRNVWLAVVITAFIAHNFWIFIAISSLVIIVLTKQEKNKMALFFILLFALPPIGKDIPGFGIVNYLFTVDYIRFIQLIVLLPAAFVISKKNNFTFTKIWADKFLLIYMLLMLILEFRGKTFTDTLRTFFYLILEILLPYYVASRGVKSLSELNCVLQAFVTSAAVAACISAFESVKHWLLFNELPNALGANFDLGAYLGRGDGIRAVGALGHPIILGYFSAVGIGFYLYLSSTIQKKSLKNIGFLLLTVGLLTPLSRGPWVGALALLVIFILQGHMAFKKLSRLFLVGIVIFTLLTLTPKGQKFIDLIPFYGKTEKYNVDYREQLFNNSLIVIDRNPIFGSIDYLKTPEMLEMTQGEGIIDIVNSYLAITLERGYVGLFLFLSIFVSVILGVRKSMKSITDKKSQLHVLGRSFVAIIIATMITIASASSIASLPVIYWSILGLGVAYTQIVKRADLNSTTNSSRP